MTTLCAIPLITRLSSRVIRILGCNPGPMTLQGTNTYLVGTGSKRLLIDSGDTDTACEYTKLLNNVLGEEKATIEHLIITHWHHDHIGGVSAVQDLLLKSNSDPATVWKFARAIGDPGGEEEEKTCPNWRILKDEQLIEIEGASLKIKSTPGHTTDHACIVLQEENALFSGDCILGETSAIFEDLHDYMISLQKILNISPKLIYPGHGSLVEHPNSKIQDYIQHRNSREAQILAFLRDRQEFCSVFDIVENIYKDTPKNLWPAAATNVNNHLKKLFKENLIISKDDKWSIN